MFKSTRRFLSNTADFLCEEIEDRLVDMLRLDKITVDNESTSKSIDQNKSIVQID